jgi:hypothetical protein
MHGPINVKSPNNISEWQMGFNSAIKGLRCPKWLSCVLTSPVSRVLWSPTEALLPYLERSHDCSISELVSLITNSNIQ